MILEDHTGYRYILIFNFINTRLIHVSITLPSCTHVIVMRICSNRLIYIIISFDLFYQSEDTKTVKKKKNELQYQLLRNNKII